MLGMAKRRTKPLAPPIKLPGRARDKGEVVNLTVELDPSIHSALMRYLVGPPRITKRAAVEYALELLFDKMGVSIKK